MNDRFKFRVWNKSENRFIHSFCCDIAANGTLIISRGIKGKEYIIDDDNYIVMQCTGLKDKNKNGKLIYEGDIVDIWKMAGNIHKKMVVKWYQPQCSFRLFDLSAMGATPQKIVDRRSLGAVTSIEVIGNIYENKELLEEYKDE